MSSYNKSAAATPPPQAEDSGRGTDAAVIACVIIVIILVLVILAAVVLRYKCRHKGTYLTGKAKGTGFEDHPSQQDSGDESKEEYFI